MPKIIPKQEDRYKRFVISNIEYQCNIRGISQEAQMIVSRCSKSAYYQRRKDPGKFTLDQLIRLSNKLKIPLWKLLKEDENETFT